MVVTWWIVTLLYSDNSCCKFSQRLIIFEKYKLSLLTTDSDTVLKQYFTSLTTISSNFLLHLPTKITVQQKSCDCKGSI